MCIRDSPEVRVFDGENEKLAGIEAFRERYVEMFIVHGNHCVDLEQWWRDSGKRGEVLVRYTERDGLIGIVQFLK